MAYKKPSSPVYHRVPRAKVGTAARESEQASYGVESELRQASAVKRNKAGKSNGASYELYHNNPMSAAMNKKQSERDNELVRKGGRRAGQPYTAIEKSVKAQNAKKKKVAKVAMTAKAAAKGTRRDSPTVAYTKALYNATKATKQALKGRKK